MLRLKHFFANVYFCLAIPSGLLFSPQLVAEEDEKSKSMSYIPMDPAFVVNFPPDSGTRFLQIALEIGAKDKDIVKIIENNRPAIRHNLVFLFSDQKPLPLKTREGKDKLREQALGEIQQVINEEGGKGNVEMVYFTSFVMQ